jgi:hypothetical protein
LTGFCFPCLPIKTSAIIIGRAIKTTLAIYIKTNAPPPFSLVIQGNFQIFPKPTADPVAAKINISLDDHCP